MTADDVRAVLASLDLERLCAIIRQGPEPLFATISGAHLYGFASPDSDVDLRGAFRLPLRSVVGLRPAKETITLSGDVDGIDLDWVAHDIRKFARMMTEHNGYVLEQLFSPLVVLTTPEHEELAALGRGCVTRPLIRHYLGFANGRRRRLRELGATVKHLLYAYRVYLTGLHAMRSGTIDSNLPSLDAAYRLPQVAELVARKREGAEALALGVDELPRHEADLDALERRLMEAHEESRLPDEATTRRELEDLVIRLRLAR